MATAVTLLLAPLAIWFQAVNNAVKEPYLDEVFHIPQAQHYCAGRWDIWDPKLTTPPGLYLISYIAKPLLGCGVTSLRAINAICLMGSRVRLLAYHSSLNIALFPPLFFFSALYYTDIASTLSWVIFYWYFLRTLSRDGFSLVESTVQVVLGVVSLSFRQTNIFWVGVAPAALTLVMELDQGLSVVKQSMYRRAEGFGDSTWSVAKTSWKMSVLYDPPVGDAYIEDYIRTVVSIFACGLKAATQPKRILRIVLVLSPYLTLITIFLSFIIWNGGVVLGDKSNHVATVNLPQMLYIWPFITFFSWPLLLPRFLMAALALLSRIGQLAHLEPLLLFKRRNFLPRPHLILLFTLLALAIIHFNTIIHPFMLADNRHYVFYIFKRLLRPSWIRYLAAPIYIFTAWACIGSCGENPPQFNMKITKEEEEEETKRQDSSSRSAASTTTTTTTNDDNKNNNNKIPNGLQTPAKISFTLILLCTTALTLCSAPLVEPRYCIIPFVMWRMHLPLYHNHHDDDEQRTTTRSETRQIGTMSPSFFKTHTYNYDYRLILETIWFLLINTVTGYIFLNWTFEWSSEKGKAQRFMW
ncbi:glycosyltransferase family 59 protein [Sphaerulina musiva SO2202]|uniref:Dol-P-Glc:Glc(2)Man(9)GlcNAc(2)-PP-Dol alpha-1,2-glucosyltransferase n=1 Tax=Sphaerulina musiva (strain SO2202) TaxID=692275 RepID=M3C9E7_SPHMS|nr:glycosyltransferase family 59 protein [Sphaerulina musiva SO2202]EMF08435.1 glycosyltransferase family 59 protein [Sphaerulina musiva SO2202]